MGMYSDMEQTRTNEVLVSVPDSIKEENRKLLERFPFLTPRNTFSGKKITDCCGPDGQPGYWPGSPDERPVYDYEYTELDDLPDGWREAFGEKMCEEIQAELDKNDPAGEIYIIQLKEKWGRMEMYMSSYTSNLPDIIEKYGDKSENTCIGCGKKATLLSTGWVSPWCKECAQKYGGSFVPIDRSRKNTPLKDSDVVYYERAAE